MIQANNFYYNHFSDRRFDGICFLPTLGSDFICSLRRGELRESCFRRQFRASWNSALRTNCLQTMDSLPTVLLKPGEADRIVAGHPWIYHTEILRLTAPVDDGGLVQVKDHRQRFLGVGFFNSKSKIHVRVLSPERVEVNEKFFEERIRAALAVRQKHLPDATSFRVVNAESDFLSGLIVDKYEDVLVVQISALGMDQRKAMIVAALQKIFSPRVIMERSDVSSRKFEGLQEANGVLFGEFGARTPLSAS